MFGILCPCGVIVVRLDRERAFKVLNEHQRDCGQTGFDAYETGDNEMDVHTRLDAMRLWKDSE